MPKLVHTCVLVFVPNFSPWLSFSAASCVCSQQSVISHWPQAWHHPALWFLLLLESSCRKLFHHAPVFQGKWLRDPICGESFSSWYGLNCHLLNIEMLDVYNLTNLHKYWYVILIYIKNLNHIHKPDFTVVVSKS